MNIIHRSAVNCEPEMSRSRWNSPTFPLWTNETCRDHVQLEHIIDIYNSSTLCATPSPHISRCENTLHTECTTCVFNVGTLWFNTWFQRHLAAKFSQATDHAIGHMTLRTKANFEAVAQRKSSDLNTRTLLSTTDGHHESDNCHTDTIIINKVYICLWDTGWKHSSTFTLDCYVSSDSKSVPARETSGKWAAEERFVCKIQRMKMGPD